MAEFPALPLWTDALVGDTQHLTQAEFGAYVLLLIAAWRNSDCSLPNDDRVLARLSRSDRNWTRIKTVIMPFWQIGQDDRLRQKRLSKERLAAANYIEQKRAAGKSSALKRKDAAATAVRVVLAGRVNGRSTSHPQHHNPSSSTTTESPPARAASATGRASLSTGLEPISTIAKKLIGGAALLKKAEAE